MGRYCSIYSSFWTDGKVVDDFTPEDRYFYLYLMSNPKTNMLGCYEITIRQMADETGYSKETVDKLITRFRNVHKVIDYDRETKELILVNYAKYNWSRSDKVATGIRKLIKAVKSQKFVSYLNDVFDAVYGVDDEDDIVWIPYPYTMDITVPVYVPVSVPVSVTTTEEVTEDSTTSLVPSPVEAPKEDNRLVGEGNRTRTRKRKQQDKQSLEDMLDENGITFSPRMTEALNAWFDYKEQRKERYVQAGALRFLKVVEKNTDAYGEAAVIEAIDQAIANGYKGVVWEALERKHIKRGPQSKADELEDFYAMTANWAETH